ncbi:MAG: porin family protein [Candidatus Eiseniibacteriota bacterium]
MKRCLLSVAGCVLACAVAAHADTVYYQPRGEHGIESVSGTIVQEDDNVVEVTTADGRTVSIPKANVYQIVRDKPSTAGPSLEALSSGEESHFDPSGSRSSRAYHFGLRGGMNISNMSVDPQDLEDDGSLKSFAAGAWWGLPLTRRLTLQAEALYSVKGDAESADGYTASTHMTYIDVPVVAKIGFLHGAPFRPSLFLGPELSVNLSASSKLEGEGNTIDVDVKDQVNPVDVGLVVGGGVDFPLGGRSYGVELRYSKGLSNAAGESANGDARNDVIAVMGSIGLQ